MYIPMKTLIYLLTTLSHDEHVRSRQNRPRIPGPDSPVPWAALKAETVQLKPSLSLLLLDLNSRINSLADPEGFWRPQYLEQKGLSVRNTSDHRERKKSRNTKIENPVNSEGKCRCIRWASSRDEYFFPFLFFFLYVQKIKEKSQNNNI